MIRSYEMRDVEVRELVKEKFGLCNRCKNRFTTEELIRDFNERYKDEEQDKKLDIDIKSVNSSVETKYWTKAMKDAFMMGYRFGLQK